jgi:hypothetical protein
MLKRILIATALWPLLALAQTLPSPHYDSVIATKLDGAAIGSITPSTGAFTSLIASKGTNIPTVGVDVQLYGAQTDGVSDSGAAINSCLSANSVCVVPPSAKGIYIHTPIVIPGGKWLIGTVSTGANGAPHYTYAGSSWLKCDNTIAQNCVTWGSAATGASGGVRNVVIAGKAGTPVTGSKGLVFAGGYSIRVEGVQIANFDTCVEFDQGISGQGINNYTQSCKTHYWVFNTWPEFSQTGGRTGVNGSLGNYGAQDNVYFTSSLGTGGGGSGPNSIEFVNYKFDNDNTPCAFRWGHYTQTPGAGDNYRFVNIYKEPLPSGASVFCSDNTVPSITGVVLENSYISQDSGPADLFRGLSPVTVLNSWTIAHNQIYLSGATAAPTRTGTYGFYDFRLIGNYMPPTTLTPGGSKVREDKLISVGNFYANGNLTINQGTYGWQQLISIDTGGGLINNSDKFNQVIEWPGVTVGTYISAPVSLGNTLAVSGMATMSGLTKLSGGAQLPVSTVSALPKCTPPLYGVVRVVSDASNPTYDSALTGGAGTTALALCNGSAWTAH